MCEALWNVGKLIFFFIQRADFFRENHSTILARGESLVTCVHALFLHFVPVPSILHLTQLQYYSLYVCRMQK